MRYTVNDYKQYINDMGTRMVIYPNQTVWSKIETEYKASDIQIVKVWEVISAYDANMQIMPKPEQLIESISEFVSNSNNLVLLDGIDAYLELVPYIYCKDFFDGLLPFIENQKLNVHFLIGKNHFIYNNFKNPKYEDSMELIWLQGDEEKQDSSIIIIPSEWVPQNNYASIPFDAMKYLTENLQSDENTEYIFKMHKKDLPVSNYHNVTVINDPNNALGKLYGINESFDIETADLLLQECSRTYCSPENFLINSFGEENISCLNAPQRLNELRNDEFWDMYIWLLKTKIPNNTYLYKVLCENITAENFLEYYIIYTANNLLNFSKQDIRVFADERESAVKKLNTVEPLIKQFVENTKYNNNSSIYFLNCGTTSELEGLIKRTALYDLPISKLPEEFDSVAPIINYYISPNFDYGNDELTKYFTKLRCFRIKNSIDDEFVKEAYDAKVPKDIKKRDSIIREYDDGETALLIVDGMGAEYYPLLINMAKQNNIKIEEQQIVSANLPSSTKFNNIKWASDRMLTQIKRADNITHEGYSKHEKCNYEKNLAELFSVFQKDILTRVVSGLKAYKRVIVTADHGASYLAVNAHQSHLDHDISWESDNPPEDWRYTSLPSDRECECTNDLELAYDHINNCTYYVVKGYNRFRKSGDKIYGLHGGATLEERLVPFVVFTNENVTEVIVNQENPADQFIENDDFDI